MERGRGRGREGIKVMAVSVFVQTCDQSVMKLLLAQASDPLGIEAKFPGCQVNQSCQASVGFSLAWPATASYRWTGSMAHTRGPVPCWRVKGR